MSAEHAEERVEVGGGPEESERSAPAAPGTDRGLIPKIKTTIITILCHQSILQEPINSIWDHHWESIIHTFGELI